MRIVFLRVRRVKTTRGNLARLSVTSCHSLSKSSRKNSVRSLMVATPIFSHVTNAICRMLATTLDVQLNPGCVYEHLVENRKRQ